MANYAKSNKTYTEDYFVFNREARINYNSHFRYESNLNLLKLTKAISFFRNSAFLAGAVSEQTFVYRYRNILCHLWHPELAKNITHVQRRRTPADVKCLRN
jgi:hypothetical protein